ncbi:MAG: efflux RND transporter periplasmic adaptor subunit [Gemmatimonadota bacterium]
MLLIAALAACNPGEANEATASLQTATVERRSIVSSVEATGTVEPIKIIDIKSQASGEILELPVELGDYVKRGDLLVRIDPRDVRNALEQARADLDVAQARYDVSQRQLRRTQTLRDSAVVTQDELENAILDFANAKAALVKAKTNLELAEDRMQDVTLRAPLSGTIVERSVEEGQIITGAREVTGGTVLMRMADLTNVQVRTMVDETDIGNVEPGLEATITVEAYPDREFHGTVLKIEPQAVVEQNVTMFAVLTRIANEGDLLRPGMNADVVIVVGREDDVLSLPNAAVKLPAEARQLAQALGLDSQPLEAARASGGRPEAGERGPGGAGPDVAAGPGRRGRPDAPRPAGGAGASEVKVGGVSVQRVRSMSQEERRKWFQKLSPADRQKMFAQFRAQRAQAEQADRARPGRPKPAFVFVYDETGVIRLKPVTIGLGNWDYTQILAGLQEGDEVVEVPLSIVQQQELLTRIRNRTGVPGVRRN